MKKTGKIILLVLVLLLVSLTSYYVGYSKSGAGQTIDLGDGKDDAHINKKLAEIKKIIDRSYLNEYDKKDMEEGIYKGFVASLGDIYTQYFTADEFKALNEQNEGEFGGVGIEVSGENGQFIEVVSPIKDTPADKSGIKTGDKIIAIDGVEFTASQMTEAVKVMRGEPGKEVKLTIMREIDGKNEKLDFDITREIIQVQSIHSQMLEDNIGYVRITTFQAHTGEQFKKAVEELKDKGAEKIVLDLRNNPGGLLDVTIDIADYLLPKGTVLNVKDKNGNKQEYTSDEKYMDLPMVTLINGGSASASEVLSGALKDFKRSEIVGENTFGKGVIQQIMDLHDGTGIKVTIAEFFTPNENKIHGVGIAPTKEVVLNKEATAIGPDALDQDNQLKEAIELLK